MRVLLSLILLVGTAVPALSWSRLGHETVALIAERHLSSNAKQHVGALLALEGKQSMADVAKWADQVRKLKYPPQPLHAVRIPDGATGYDPAHHCPGHDCAVSKINDSIAVLTDPAAAAAVKVWALKYLIHLVGDIHQPLHAYRVKGSLLAGKKKVTFHGVWDGVVPRYLKLPADKLAALVDVTEPAPRNVGTAADWAWESHVVARDQVIPGAAAFRFEDPAVLPKDYAKRNWPIAALRLKAAGMRLAWTLNEIYRDSD
jgi:S1/P1 Nuclease.